MKYRIVVCESCEGGRRRYAALRSAAPEGYEVIRRTCLGYCASGTRVDVVSESGERVSFAREEQGGDRPIRRLPRALLPHLEDYFG